MRVVLACLLVSLVALAGCAAPRSDGLRPEEVLAGFREASPWVASLCDEAVAVAVFVGVEGTHEGCSHEGLLYLRDGSNHAVRLHCLEESRAPGGYSYHQLVLLGDEERLDQLLAGSLSLDGFSRLAPHDDHDPPASGSVLGPAPGHIVSTHRSQLLFGDQAVRQEIELLGDG